MPAGGLVLFGQGDGDFGPERALGLAAPAAGVLLPEEGALGAVLGAVLQPADGGFGGGIGIAPMPAPVEAQQLAQGVEAGVTRALGQQQADPGEAPRFVQALLAQPALAGCLPLGGQQMPAQAPGTVGLLVLVQCVGVIHQPQKVVPVGCDTRVEIALEGDLGL